MEHYNSDALECRRYVIHYIIQHVYFIFLYKILFTLSLDTFFDNEVIMFLPWIGALGVRPCLKRSRIC
jgi:hypothetical protein